MTESFWLHFNRFGQKRGEKVWVVYRRGRTVETKKVVCDVPLETVYRGHGARQPRAYLKGRGVVTTYRDRVCIHAH